MLSDGNSDWTRTESVTGRCWVSSRNGILVWFLLHLTGCDGHVLFCYYCVRTRLSSRAQNVATKLRIGDIRGDSICDITRSCASYCKIPLCIVNIVITCSTHRHGWRVLANLATGGLQQWSCSSLIGIYRTAGLLGLVAVLYVVREL